MIWKYFPFILAHTFSCVNILLKKVHKSMGIAGELPLVERIVLSLQSGHPVHREGSLLSHLTVKFILLYNDLMIIAC